MRSKRRWPRATWTAEREQNTVCSLDHTQQINNGALHSRTALGYTVLCTVYHYRFRAPVNQTRRVAANYTSASSVKMFRPSSEYKRPCNKWQCYITTAVGPYVGGHFEAERVGTLFPLLVFNKRIIDSIAKLHQIAGFCIYNRKIFHGVIPPDPNSNAPALGPRHQSPFGSPAFPMFMFYERTTALRLYSQLVKTYVP